MELLKTENLCKIYADGKNKVVALDNVNFAVKRGEFVAVVGTSGSGKSTLMHLLGGVDTPTSGSIWVEEQNLAAMKEKELSIFRRRKVGLVYQFYNLIPTLNVRQNILLPMLLDGREPIEEEFSALVETLGLSDRLTHLPSELSGGQQQRVAVGRSLIYRPAILLADEPTGNLDRQTSVEILELLKLSNRQYKQTIILITHDEKIALEADRIVRIEDGKIVSDSFSAGGDRP